MQLDNLNSNQGNIIFSIEDSKTLHLSKEKVEIDKKAGIISWRLI